MHMKFDFWKLLVFTFPVKKTIKEKSLYEKEAMGIKSKITPFFVFGILFLLQMRQCSMEL